MCFVDDQGVVAAQVRIRPGLGQQNAVGHQLDQCLVVGLILKPDLKTHQVAALTEFRRHPLCDAPRGKPARLGMADQAPLSPANLQAQFGQLGGLARTGLTGQYHHLVRLQGREDL